MNQPVQHGYVELGDLRQHDVTPGQGPAVVLLHGWPRTCFLWRDVLPGLAVRDRVIASDLRGSIAEICGHRIAEERPDGSLRQLPAFFGEDQG